MSMSPRLTRAFQALSTVELDEKSRFGALGEFHMQQVLDDEQLLYVFNPIVPIPKTPGRFTESDFLIYAYGSLFCVEIKNWFGSVYYPPANWETGAGLNELPRLQQTNTDYDTSHVVQNRQGRHVVKIHDNPLQKTEIFIGRLKRFLSNIDYRFKKYYIRAAVGFSDVADTDISAIYNFDKGIMRTSELASFFEKYGHSRAPSQPPSWLRSAFYRMPTWDVVVTKQNELIRGVLIGRELSFTSMDKQVHRFPYERLQSVTFIRRGERLGVLGSHHDDVTIHWLDGNSDTLSCIDGEVYLDSFGKRQVHKFVNISHIVIGIQNRGLQGL
jgi:Nuclease-related domain